TGAAPSAPRAASADHVPAARDTGDVRDLGSAHLRVRRDRARHGSVRERRRIGVRRIHARDAHGDRKTHDVPPDRRRGRRLPGGYAPRETPEEDLTWIWAYRSSRSSASATRTSWPSRARARARTFARCG